MIKINKTTKVPKVLKDNQTNWTNSLLADIKTHGSFNKLPDSIKTDVGIKYKDKEIKKALIPTEDTKCAFCEMIPNETGYIEIEHFYPKSIYPDQTFEWSNLLPSCKRCNLIKTKLDTLKSPIVKPDVDDPETLFTYDNIKLVVKKDATDKAKANRTIKKLDLNQFRVIKPRSELLVNLNLYENGLEQTLEELSKAKNSNKINRLKSNILDSLDKLEDLTKTKSKHAGFCRDFIGKSKIISLARTKI